jgi:sugar lactone lactonase YvrE
LGYPQGVAADASGNIYIADTYNRRIRMVTKSTGNITTVAGDGKYSADTGGDGGQATSAYLYYPSDVAVDASGNIYIADTYVSRIRMVTKSTGIITTVAGKVVNDYKGDNGDGGLATSAYLYYPYGVAVDASGNIYIADSGLNRIRMVTKSTGIITTVAGGGTLGIGGNEMSGYSGDGGLATSARLAGPNGVAVDTSGNIYIADSYNNRVRMVTKSTGIITTVAGNGTPSIYKGEGRLATSVSVKNPHKVAVDASGNIYIVDTIFIMMVTKSTGIITILVDSGRLGYSGDGGPAKSATVNNVYGVALDASGNIYIADTYNHCIRMITPIGPAPTRPPSPTPTTGAPTP